MKQLHNQYLIPVVLFLFTLLGSVLFFTNLSWGSPLFFHPDERNIASAISQLHAPNQMHPNFFAYGSLPLYAIYFVGVGINFLTQLLSKTTLDIFQVPFEQAILISRGFSATFAVLLIPILYCVGKMIGGRTTGLLASLLFVLSVGIVQYAHFGTFEMWLTFFSVLLFWACLSYGKSKSSLQLLGIGVLLGTLVSIKISSLILFPLIVLVLLMNLFSKQHIKTLRHLGQQIALLILSILFILCISGILYLLTNPFALLTPHEFLGTMRYESGVALGTVPVFYTGEFYNTIPVGYHFLSVYPFLLNPFVFFLFCLSLLWVGYSIYTKREKRMMLLLLFFSVLFLSQTFLFVKWTRYLVPTLPFIYLLVASFLRTLATGHTTRQRLPGLLFVMTIFFASSFFVFAYVKTALLSPDTRVTAAFWAEKRIPKEADIVSEVYDLGITAFNPFFTRITLANIYDLDTNQDNTFRMSEIEKVRSAEYIVLPSQRIFKTRLMNKKQFPNGYTLYTQITEGQGDYQKIYETPCDIFCRILYLGDPNFRFEGTANIFDRPSVMIYQKMK